VQLLEADVQHPLLLEELVIVLPLTYLILAVRAQIHLRLDLAVIDTQAVLTAEVLTEVTQVLELMEVVRPEVETLLCTHFQRHLATTLSMERAFLNHQTTVHKPLVAEPAIALLLIYQTHAARAQVLHSRDLVVITTQAQVLQ